MLREQARAARRGDGGREPAGTGGLASSPYRVDRDRIAASPFFARLGGVTQVVSPTGPGLLLHNRLTHSLKVAQLARAVAERLAKSDGELVDQLGGCDPDVVEAASLAHDLGHPPFGHLGERVLDRLARTKFGLPDGFEGNAQTLRILTTTDVRGPSAAGLDLTAAARAALLKYPWARMLVPQPHPSHQPVPPRGAAEPPGEPGTGSAKFSCYFTELDDFAQAMAPFTGLIPANRQTVEAAVMDTADDIAYAIHDVEDFHRVGVLQHAPVAAELSGWARNALDLAAHGTEFVSLRDGRRRPGHAMEALRRRLHAKDGWIVDDELFAAAVRRVLVELVDGLLAVPFDGSIQAEQNVASFSARWTERLVDGVRVVADPHPRAAHVTLAGPQWHEVAVLKFVHRHFVLERPELALHQRGQARLLTSLVDALHEWITDTGERARLPRRLHDLVGLAYDEYAGLAADSPEVLGGTGATPLQLAYGRAIVDFVASLTDAQTASLLEVLAGRSTALWTDALVL